MAAVAGAFWQIVFPFLFIYGIWDLTHLLFRMFYVPGEGPDTSGAFTVAAKAGGCLSQILQQQRLLESLGCHCARFCDVQKCRIIAFVYV